MKKVILKFIVIVSCCTFSINKAQCKTNSVAELKEDAAFIYKTYITNSPRPYLYCDSAELKRNYDIFLSQLTHPMSRWEFIPYAQEFISKANDVHSRIFAEGEMGLRAFFIKVPYFTIRVKSNGQMFVNQILNPKSKLKQGYEIRKINKLSVDSLEKLATKYYSNESQTIKYVQLENYL